MTEKKMRIAVFGAGGVGGYFGGRLAQAGEEVVFIARGAHLNALRQAGLQVESIKGDFALQPVQAVDDPAQVGVVEAVLVCVKAWQVPEAARSMRPLVGADTIVIPLENGVDAPDQLIEVLGAAPVLGGVCRISSFIAAPGHIRHVGIEPYIAFGTLDGSPNAQAERLRLAFERAGALVEMPNDIQAAMWRKFVFIAALSGVGAAARAPLGVLRSLPETRRLLEQTMQEVVSVGRARGVRLAEEVVGQTLANIDGMQPGVYASMQRDIMEGHPSELEAQNGAVVRMGREAGVPTPVNEFLYESLLPQELLARGKLSY